jgi:acetyl-CoA acyltransferase
MAREAVVVASSRTPLAKSFRGSFNLTRPDDLAAHCIKDVLGKVPQLDHAELEDVILGCGQPHGSQGHNIARVAAIRAGLPVSVAGTTINRFCSSGLNAVAVAAWNIVNEGVDVAIGGGVESITMMQRDSSPNPWVKERKPGIYMVMGDTAEVVAKRYKISRQVQDEYALLSQQRTARAQNEGFFKEELAPLQVTRGVLDKKTGEIVGKEEFYVDRDECNRADTTLDGLLKLPPHFDKDSGEGTVTAGNSSQLSDGASATLLMSADRAKALGVTPKLVFRGFAIAGCEPDEMGIGPVYAVPKLLKRHGLKISDIDVWELNEAFASQVVYCRDRLGLDPAKLNPNGGSISIGHPFGMTGSRMVGTIANEMLRRKARYGVVTMCIGGGQGAAGLFEACRLVFRGGAAGVVPAPPRRRPRHDPSSPSSRTDA